MIIDAASSDQIAALIAEAESTSTVIEEIRLAPGTYDDLVLKNLVFDKPVTITSADPDNPAVFTGRLTLKNVTNLIIDDIDFSLTGLDEGANRPRLEILDSSGITVSDAVMTGFIPGPGEGYAPSELTAALGPKVPVEGYGHGAGLRVRNSDTVLIDNLDISQFRTAIGFNNSENVTLTNSHIHHIRRDGVTLSDVRDVTIADNLFHSFQPVYLYDERYLGDHADMIQYWGTNSSFGIENLEISGNVMLQGDGGVTQGIFGRMNSADGGKLEFSGFKIHDNIINTGQPNAIFLSDVTDAEVMHNLLLPAPVNTYLPRSTNNIPVLQVRSDAVDFTGALRADRGQIPQTLAVEGNILIGPSGETVTFDPFSQKILTQLANGIGENLVLSARPEDPTYWGNAYPELVGTGITDLASLADHGQGPREIADWIVELVPQLDLSPRQAEGTAGDDVMIADHGETVIGLAGDDVLIGTDGDEFLAGGPGDDILQGGAGGDLFSFQAPTTVDLPETDIITDLNFQEGDLLLFTEGFVRDLFDDSPFPNNDFRVLASGAMAVVDSPADLREMSRHDQIDAIFGDTGLERILFDLDDDGTVDWIIAIDPTALEGRDGIPETPPETPSDPPPATPDEAPADDPATDPVEEPAPPPPPQTEPPAEPDSGSDDAADRPDDGETTVEDVLLDLPTAPKPKIGDAGDDRLYAQATDDFLEGNEGDDILHGGGGNDILSGGSGEDYLRDGWGSDILSGGAGADRFSFTPMENKGSTDTVLDLDFDEGDVLELAGFAEGYFAALGGTTVKTFSSADRAIISDTDGLLALDAMDAFSLQSLNGSSRIVYDGSGDGADDWTLLLPGLSV